MTDKINPSAQDRDKKIPDFKPKYSLVAGLLSKINFIIDRFFEVDVHVQPGWADDVFFKRYFLQKLTALMFFFLEFFNLLIINNESSRTSFQNT